LNFSDPRLKIDEAESEGENGGNEDLILPAYVREERIHNSEYNKSLSRVKRVLGVRKKVLSHSFNQKQGYLLITSEPLKNKP
ncbi:unnamed protein product, partial [Arabidopsis halleri]